MIARTKKYFLSSLGALVFSIVSATSLKIAGITVLVGSLIADIFVILYVPSGRTEKILSAICTGGIVLGIIAEEVAAHEISRLEKASRREILTGELAAITEKLRPFAGTQFDCGFSSNSGEQADFWWDLQPAIVAAGWVHVPWEFGDPAEAMRGGGLVITQGDRPVAGSIAATNVEIHLYPPQRAALLPAALALIAALNEIGIAATDAGYNAHSATATAIHILIGDRA